MMELVLIMAYVIGVCTGWLLAGIVRHKKSSKLPIDKNIK